MTDVLEPRILPLERESPLHVRAAAAAASRKKYPERARARNAVYRALKSGVLVRPDRCARCGKACKPQASHDDYARPLDVEWLCRACHARKDLPTHCKWGHEFTPENTYIYMQYGGQRRACCECRRRPRKKGQAHAEAK